MTATAISDNPLFWQFRNTLPETDYVALLENSSLDVNARDENGDTPLHVACEYYNPQAVAALLTRSDIDVNARNRKGFTALHRAAHANGGYPGEECFFRLLCDARVSLNIGDNDGQTPLMWAATCGDPTKVKALLARPDILINVPDQRGWTALMHACSSRYPMYHAAPFFYRSDLDFNVEAGGVTALSIARKQSGADDCVAMLEQLGAV